MPPGGQGNPNALLRVLQGGQQSLIERMDSWQNLATGLGTLARDKATQLMFRRTVELPDEVLDAMYHDDDLSATIVDIFPDEALRQPPTVKIGMASEDASDQEKDTIKDQEVATNQRLDDWLAFDKVGDAARWGRLFGLGGILVGADDGQDVREPLNEANIRTIKFLAVMDRRDFSAIDYYDQPLEANFGEPRLYQLHRVAGSRATAAQDAGIIVHETRIITFPGARTTRRKRNENRGADFSVLQRIHDVMQQFVQSWQSVAHVMTDGNQAVWKIKGLMTMIASGNKKALLDRMEIADIARSVTRAVMLDADSEEFSREAPNLTGVPEVLDRMMMRLSSASRIPVTILMGRSPAGQNATGDADFRAFFGAVQSYQIKTLEPRINRLVRLLFLSKDGPTKGAEPESWSLDWPPLWQPDLEELVKARLTMAQADALYLDRGALKPETVIASRFPADGFSIETMVPEDEFEEEEEDPPETPEEMEARLRAQIAAEGGSGHLNDDDDDGSGSGHDDDDPNREDRFDRVEKRGDEYVLVSDTGRVLGRHKTRAAAEEQERAIKAAERGRR